MTDSTAHERAAIMVGASSPGLLHYDLYEAIADANELVHKAEGALVSRQAIAVLIATWKRANPGVSPIGE